jgi:hypothetical protein
VYNLIPLPRSDGDLTLANRTAILDQIKNQPPSTSHRWLTEITGVPHLQSHLLFSSKTHCERNGHYERDNREHLENGSVKERIHTLKRLLFSGKAEELAEQLVTRIAKQHTVGCLKGYLGIIKQRRRREEQCCTW